MRRSSSSAEPCEWPLSLVWRRIMLRHVCILFEFSHPVLSCEHGLSGVLADMCSPLVERERE